MALKNRKIEVKGKKIGVTSDGKEDFICMTDIARYKNPEATGLVISHWLSTRYTIEFMGLWEKMHNPDFNVTEFRNIRQGEEFAILTNIIHQEWAEVSVKDHKQLKGLKARICVTT